MPSPRAVSCADLEQIRKDIPRSFPEQARVQARTTQIEAILVEHSVFDPEIGYCQGMSCVAAVVAAHIADVAVASSFFQRLVDGLRGFWLPGFPLLTAGAVAFEKLQKSCLPTLHDHLKYHGASYEMFLPDAWLTLFSRWLPFASLWRAFVFIEAEGIAGVLSLTTVLFRAHEAALLDTDDFTSLFVLLKSLGRQPRQPDVEQLILSAKMMLPVVADVVPVHGEQLTSWATPKPTHIGSPTSASLVRTGSRVLYANSSLEAIANETSDGALEQLAQRTRTLSLQGLHDLPVVAQDSELTSISNMSNQSRAWFPSIARLSACIWCTSEVHQSENVHEWA